MAKIDYLKILNKNYTDFSMYEKFLLGKNFDFSSKKILDYGSGNGKLCEFLLHRGAKRDQIFCADIEQSHMDYINKHTGIFNFSLIDAINQKTHYADNFFDCIFCLDVIEHSKNYDAILQELKRLIKKDGIIIICTPNRLTRHLDRELLSKGKFFQILTFNIKRLFGKAFLDPTHELEFFPHQFKKLLQKYNFRIQEDNFSFVNYIPFISTRSFIVHVKK